VDAIRCERHQFRADLFGLHHGTRFSGLGLVF
jgi:hypothetical protein